MVMRGTRYEVFLKRNDGARVMIDVESFHPALMVSFGVHDRLKEQRVPRYGIGVDDSASTRHQNIARVEPGQNPHSIEF